MVTGLVVLDPAPAPLSRRGAARSRAVALAAMTGRADLAGEVDRRTVASRRLLERLGVTGGPAPAGAVEAEGWLIAGSRWEEWRRELVALVDRRDHREDRLVRDGVNRAEAVRQLGLPDPGLLAPLVASLAELELADGQVRDRRRGRVLDASLAASLGPVLARLAEAPFDAPDGGALTTAGLDARRLAAAEAAGAILVLTGEVVLAPDAPARATDVLGRLRQPFTASEARQALDTSRRVAIPLLEHLDRTGVTRRVDPTHRMLTGRPAARRGAGAG